MENEISAEKLNCQMLELKYMKQMRQYINPEITNIYPIVYPIEWFSNKDYVKKSEILKEAMENNVLIIKTKSYQDIIEGVRHNTNN